MMHSFAAFASRYPIGMLARLVFARAEKVEYPEDVKPVITRLCAIEKGILGEKGEFATGISTQLITQEQYDEMRHEDRLNYTSMFAPAYSGRAIIEDTKQTVFFESGLRRVLETTSTVIDEKGELVNVLDVHLELPLGVIHPVPHEGNMIACLVKYETNESGQIVMNADEWFGCSEQFFRTVVRLQRTIEKIDDVQERKHGFASLNPAEQASLVGFCKGNKTATLNCAKALAVLCDLEKDNVTIEEYCRFLTERFVMHPIFETPDSIHVWSALVCLSFGVHPLEFRLPNYCQTKYSPGVQMQWDIPAF